MKMAAAVRYWGCWRVRRLLLGGGELGVDLTQFGADGA
jgi:hypothetical protein